jgi:hypothetical protein
MKETDLRGSDGASSEDRCHPLVWAHMVKRRLWDLSVGGGELQEQSFQNLSGFVQWKLHAFTLTKFKKGPDWGSSLPRTDLWTQVPFISQILHPQFFY